MAEEKVPLKRRPVVVQIKGWYALVVISVVVGLVGAGNLWYTHQTDLKRAKAEREARAAVTEAERVADRRWCGLMKIMDDAYNNPNTPPSTPLGLAIAKAMREIYQSLDC